MSDEVVRLGIVAVVVLGAAGVAWILGRVRKPPHPDITVGDVGDRPGVVVFTSATCPTCGDAISVLEDVGLPFREVTYDLEPDRFETWGVVAVPVTVVVDGAGSAVDVLSGVPSRGRLARSAARAGLARG